MATTRSARSVNSPSLLIGTIAATQTGMLAIVALASTERPSWAIASAIGLPVLVAVLALAASYAIATRFTKPVLAAVESTHRGTARRRLAVAGIAAALALLAAGSVQQSLAATVTPGAGVIIDTDAVTLRADASLSADSLGVYEAGTWAYAVDGPVSADGYDWYQIELADGTTGWTVVDYLANWDDRQIGSTITIEIDTWNLRDSASTGGTVLAELPTGTVATILDAPVAADGYAWYQVSTDYGTGFIAADGIATDYDGYTGIALGSSVIVSTDALNLRADASVSAEVIDVLLTGATATIIDGPASADGYTWYQVSVDGVTGWVVSDFFILS